MGAGHYYQGPFGAISKVYYAYSPARGSLNPLGCPVSGEKKFVDDTDIPFNTNVDKYQEFEHGSIYYNSIEKAAYAIFNAVDVRYQQDKATLGLPITSEIGDANTRPFSCRAYFQNGYIECSADLYMVVTAHSWEQIGYLAELVMRRDFPDLMMPFSNSYETATFSSGPHSIGSNPYSNSSSGHQSGIDIGGNNMEVLAMAPGTIIDMYPDPYRDGYKDCHALPHVNFGCWVAIRHDFSGTIMIYAHIQPHLQYSSPEPISIGQHVTTGNVLGNTTNSIIGHSDGPHLHLEYRNGIRYCSDCWNVSGKSTGQPIDWHGVVIEDYLFSSAECIGNDSYCPTGNRYDYDGTVVRQVGAFSKSKYSDSDIAKYFGNLLTKPIWKFEEYQRPGIWHDQKSWMTKYTWEVCSNHSDFPSKCEKIDKAYGNTLFSNGGLLSWNEPTPSQQLLSSDWAYFSSTNEQTEYEPPEEIPYPNPQPTPTIGGPNSDCPNDNRDGVYIYENPYYTGDCTYSTDNVVNFGLTPVGNDRLSSVLIRGDYKVKLYEDINFGGRSDELNDSDSNLDIRTLGDQYSSAKISENITQCPDDGREGAYMYSNINYLGDCYFSTVNIPYFGDTPLGDNDLSSIRFIGNWDAKLYKDANYNGGYEFVGSDEPDLNSWSLGQQFSSAKLIRNDYGPTPTPSPNTIVLLSGTVNNGGFESQNMSGWTSQGGTFVIDQVNPHSGWYYVKGTTAEEAKFYRYFDLTPWQTQINQGRVSSSWRVYVDPGDHENFKFNVKFLDANNNSTYSYGTGWVWHEGGYDDRGRTLDVVPANTTKVYIEMNMRRVMTDFTDCDVDDFYLDIRIDPGTPPTPTPEPTSTPIPDCLSNFGDQAIMYDYSYCSNYAGSFPFGIIENFLNLENITWSDRISSIYLPEGKSLLIYDGPDGTGQAKCITNSINDLNDVTFDDNTQMSNRATSIVLFNDDNCLDLVATNATNIEIPLAGEVVTSGYDLKNISNSAIYLDGILIGIHGPYCEEWNCPNINDYPWAKKIVLDPGETYEYRTERIFNIVDSNYLYEFLSLDANGSWKSYFPTNQFSVGRGIEVTSPVTLTPNNPVVGDEVTAKFTIKNFGTRSITLPNIMAIAKGPNCTTWDCPNGWADFPWVNEITLEPGEEYTYSQSRPFYMVGTGYFADVAFGDHNVWWYEVPENVRLHFEVDGFLNYLPVINK